MRNNVVVYITVAFMGLASCLPTQAQIGKRFPSERKVVIDPETGAKLIFLTSSPEGDSKIYQTHNQWTSDGQWLIFRSGRVKGEAMAVNEKNGDIVQVTEGGYRGMLNIARKSMRLFYMRPAPHGNDDRASEVVQVDLAKLFKDSKQGTLQLASEYQKVCGVIPAEMGARGDMALDADEEWVWFRVGKNEAAKHLPEGAKIEDNFGPRNMGAGPGGIAGMNVMTGEIRHVVSVPFQVGHIQSNPWVSGQIVFCWETGGKAPQRTWIVNSDGTGLRPLYPESPYEWVTHEAIITPTEVAIAIMGHRAIPGVNAEDRQAPTGVRGANPGQETEWGPCGTREKPTGLGIVNIETREMRIVGQTKEGSGLWHVSGSPDGRFAVGDDFDRNIYLIDRHTGEMALLSAGHKTTAADHPHPSFSVDGTKIQIQSAMLSEDGRSMNICVIPVPESWLKRGFD
jgi:oligogalacturonide lyase